MSAPSFGGGVGNHILMLGELPVLYGASNDKQAVARLCAGKKFLIYECARKGNGAQRVEHAARNREVDRVIRRKLKRCDAGLKELACAAI